MAHTNRKWAVMLSADEVQTIAIRMHCEGKTYPEVTLAIEMAKLMKADDELRPVYENFVSRGYVARVE